MKKKKRKKRVMCTRSLEMMSFSVDLWFNDNGQGPTTHE